MRSVCSSLTLCFVTCPDAFRQFSLLPALITCPLIFGTRDSWVLMCSALRVRACTVLSTLRAETKSASSTLPGLKNTTARQGTLPVSLLWAGSAKTSAREEGTSQSPQIQKMCVKGVLTKTLQTQMYLC